MADGGRHVDDLSASEQATLGARISKSQDSSATRTFVDELDTVDNVRRLLDQDQASVNRLVDWHANPGSYRNIDPDLEASDFVHVARNGDVSETRLMARGPDESGSFQVRWLENGDLDRGWTHIEARHIRGTQKIDEKDATSIFPTGKEVKGERMPNTISQNEVIDMTYDAIKRGTPTQQGQKTRYYFEPVDAGYPNSGIDDMQVLVLSDGTIETAYPNSGSAVKRWVPDLNDGQGGFVDTT
ncbi:hypothetical protein [Natronorubrum sp. DTA28]|uniref:hypothetical protein n=1 Tax=Natronorubrum sp. DTA28 TaxID=3447019 RepID=UPI003F834F06